VFHLDVAMVFKCFSGVFASVSDAYFKCFICFLLYVAIVAFRCFKSTQVLHMGWAWKAAGGAGDVRGGAGDIWGGASDFWGGAGPLLWRPLASLTR
jgi:hypothetical protein